VSFSVQGNAVTSLLQVLDSGPGEPAWNMALDEALLRSASRSSQPILRLYAWHVPAATFGYSQVHAEVARRTLLRPLIRRPTGGGIVPHDADWTYSLTLPPDHAWYHLRARDSYRTMHEWIRQAFALLGVETELAPSARPDAPGQCFVGYEQFDVLWKGRKIAGAAQRRTREGMLIQGSIQPPPRVERSVFHEAMLRAAPREFFKGSEPLSLPEEVRDRADALVEARYGRAEYNEGR
jgi:lipoate-protein ligase A